MWRSKLPQDRRSWDSWEIDNWTISIYIPPITYYWTVLLILHHSYLVGNLLISQRDMSGLRLWALSNNRLSGGSSEEKTYCLLRRSSSSKEGLMRPLAVDAEQQVRLEEHESCLTVSAVFLNTTVDVDEAPEEWWEWQTSDRPWSQKAQRDSDRCEWCEQCITSSLSGCSGGVKYSVLVSLVSSRTVLTPWPRRCWRNSPLCDRLPSEGCRSDGLTSTEYLGRLFFTLLPCGEEGWRKRSSRWSLHRLSGQSWNPKNLKSKANVAFQKKLINDQILRDKDRSFPNRKKKKPHSSIIHDIHHPLKAGKNYVSRGQSCT